MVFVVFYNARNPKYYSGFTLVEVIVAITLLGIGITSAVTALTRFNAFASSSRNSTGAYAAVMNQIDTIESAAPFSPAHREDDGTPSPQIPPELVLDSVRGNQPLIESNIPIYQYKDPANPSNTIVVNGTRTTSVVDASKTYNGANLYMRRVTVTVTYKFLGKDYSLSMSTLRASDE